jgi:co-chaperonin GroES (HSP10)
MKLEPQRDKVVVRVLPEQVAHGVILRAPTETPIRRAEVVAVGPDARVEVGGTYLVNILSGQQFGDDLLLLPDKPGQSAFLAEWHDD